MSLLISLCDAVVARINATEFSEQVQATRNYFAAYQLEKITALTVTVIPKGVKIDPGSRSSDYLTYEINVGVQDRVGQNKGRIDQLIGLTEEIAVAMGRGRILESPAAVSLGVENDPIYVPEHLLECGIFTGIITVRLKASR